MARNIDLKAIERKAYLSYHQDGLLEIFIGFFIAIFGLGMTTGLAYMGGIWAAVGIPIWASVKKAVTLPRMGFVDFGEERKRKVRKEKLFFVLFFTVTLVLGVGMFFLFQGGSVQIREQMHRFPMAPLGLIVAVGLASLTYWRGMRRFLVFAGAVLIAVFAGPALGIPHPVYFALPGVLMLCSGLVLLFRFLRRYPKPEEGAPDA